MAEDLMLCPRITRRPAGRLYFEASTGVCHRSVRGWESARAQLRRLGYWSGRFRRGEEVSGSWPRQVPVRGLVRLPRLATGLAVWAVEFYQGVSSLISNSCAN